MMKRELCTKTAGDSASHGQEQEYLLTGSFPRWDVLGARIRTAAMVATTLHFAHVHGDAAEQPDGVRSE